MKNIIRLVYVCAAAQLLFSVTASASVGSASAKLTPDDNVPYEGWAMPDDNVPYEGWAMPDDEVPYEGF